MNDTADSSTPASRPFRVADWVVDPATHRLQRGDAEVRLEPKVMALLVCLAARAGEPVTREELERQVWGRTVVGYDALTSSIIKLRKALGDDSRQPRFIETVSKKGYRLIAPVGTTAVPSEPPVPLPPRRVLPRHRMLAAGLALLAIVATLLVYSYRDTNHRLLPDVTDKPSIVVLPFGNLGNDPAQAYLSEGITADITTAISKLSGLFVVASASARNFPAPPGDVKQVAEALGVRYILDGNVRRTGKQLRVNVQLVDAATGFQIWGERYDREMKDVLDVQDDIATKVAATLSVKLTEAERRHTARHYTVSIEAYDDFLRGQSFYVRSTPEDNLQARALFQQALERDPGFARAHSAMALSYVDDFRFRWGREPETARAQALTHATRALALDDQLPQAHWALGYVYLYQREYPRAAEAIERAVELNPNDADGYVLLALSRVYNGNYDTAVRLLRRAMQLNPRYPARYASTLGQAYYFLGRHEDAEVALRDAIERNANLLPAQVFLTATLARSGRGDEAAWAAYQVRALAPDFTLANVPEMSPLRDSAKLQTLVEDLRRAGL